MPIFLSPRSVGTILALACLAGCGGGGGGGSSGGASPSPGPSPTPSPSPTPGCTITNPNQTCVAGVLLTPASDPPPGDPPPIDSQANRFVWETPEYLQNYGLAQIGASFAYAKNAFGQNTTIAVIDVGNQTNHPEVYGRVDPDSTSIYDERGDIVEGDNRWAHGLQCATLAMGTKNDTGAHGVAIDATLLYIRADAGYGWPSLNDFPLHTPDDLAQSIDYAVANGADVISLSLGVSEDPDRILYDAIERATNAGVVIVTALGNYFDGRADAEKKIVLYPAAYGGDPAFQGRLVLAGASNASGEIAFFSPRAGNDGQVAFLLAPGANMLVPGGGLSRNTLLQPGNTTSYVRDSGTSFAAPHIAGAIALVMSGTGTNAVDALQLLYDNAVDVGEPGTDPVNGVGRIDLRPIFE